MAVAGGMYSDVWMGLWLGEEKVSDVKACKRYHRFICLATLVLGRSESHQKYQSV